MQNWQMAAGIVAVVTSVVGLPLGVLVFFIRHTRRQESEHLAQAHRRLDQLDVAVRRLWAQSADLRRDGVTKEEWVRESMWCRGKVETIQAVLVRLESHDDQVPLLAAATARLERGLDRVYRSRSGGAGESRDGGDQSVATTEAK